MHAFTLPPNKAFSSLSLSKWNGKPVSHPRIQLTSRNHPVPVRGRKFLIISQRTDDSNPELSNADLDRPFPETNEDVPGTQIAPTLQRPMSIWLFVIDNAVQLTVLALAIAGSIHTRRRVLTHLVALLSVPQLTLMVNRIWTRIRSPTQSLFVSADSSISVDKDTAPVSESAPTQETATKEDQEDYKEELSLVRSKIFSTSIKTAVAEEMDSLRYAIEQIEQTTEQRQQARNLAIAEAIASLDESLRSLRRSVDTRNQVEKSAPFALVSELEIVKSRLKQAEQEKTELELRLRTAEDNFEEAKRQGERARREADEASSKELGLRTELAVASSRLLQLEDVTERLDRAERKNDELQEQIINGTREQEGLRQSAEDAERRVIRVENIAKILREKIQELAGKPLQRHGQEGGDLFGGLKEKSEDQFYPQRLRERGDLRPDSVVYQELLREEKGLRSPKWPHDPLGTEGDRQDIAQQKKLPDDGGFGVGESLSDRETTSIASDNKLLSPEGSNDPIFSFSRGEFDKSDLQKERTEKSSEEDTQTVEKSLRSPDEASKGFVSPGDESSVDKLGAVGQGDEGSVDTLDAVAQGDDASQPESQDEKSITSSTVTQTLKDESLVGTTESDLHVETPQSGQYKSDDGAFTESSQEEISEGTSGDTEDHADAEGGKESDEDSVLAIGSISAPSESSAKEMRSPRKQDEAPDDLEDQASVKKLEIFPETVRPVEPDTATMLDAGPQGSVEDDTASEGDAEYLRDKQSVPTKLTVSVEPTSDSDDLDTKSRMSSGEQGSEYPSAEAVTDEAKFVTVRKPASYLDTLSQNEQSRPPETVEHQLSTARELVKKARTRGLAVKQADLLFERATEKLEHAFEQIDDRSEVEADLGGCLLAWAKTNIASPLAQERLARALKLLTSSLESQPNNETVLFNTGLCLCLMASTSSKQKALKDYETACDMYERLLQNNNNSRIACFNCGLAYVSLGRLSLGNENNKNSRGYFERATGLFQRSLELKPGDSKAISYLDGCRRQLQELDIV